MNLEVLSIACKREIPDTNHRLELCKIATQVLLTDEVCSQPPRTIERAEAAIRAYIQRCMAENVLPANQSTEATYFASQLGRGGIDDVRKLANPSIIRTTPGLTPIIIALTCDAS